MIRSIGAMLLLTAAVVGSGSASLADPITITFRFNDSEAEVRGALDDFQAHNPNIKIELQRIGWSDARTQFLREAAVGEGPDVAHVAQVWVTEMGDAGALLPLGGLLKTSPPKNGFDDFVAQDLAKGKSGEIFGLPWTTDTWAMVYRTDLLKQAGVDALPRSWKELRDDSAEVTKKTGKAGFGFPAGSSASGAMWFLANFYWWSNGKALIVQRDNGSYALGLNADDIAECMKYFKGFIDTGDNPRSNLAASDAHDPSIIRALVSGEQAMAAMPPNTFKQVLQAYADANLGKPLPFASSPFPKGSVASMSMIGGRMLVINGNTKHPKEAWELVKYLASENVFANHYRTQFPAQKSLLNKVDFGAELKGFAEQLQTARTWGPYASGPVPIGTMWNEVGRAFGTALSGQQSPEDASKALLQTMQKLLASKG